MRFAFTAEQLEFRDTVAAVLKNVCPPALVRAAWSDPAAGRKPWETLAGMGVLGMAAPEAVGGLAMAPLDWVLIAEAAGYAGLPAPLAATAFVALPLLAELGAPPATFDAAIGGDTWVVSDLAGPLVANARQADAFVLARGDAVILADADAVALDQEPSVDRARHTARIVRVADVEPLAAGPAATAALERARLRGSLAAAAELVGAGRRMLAMTVDYVQVRKQFGQPIGGFQAVKHMLADVLLKLEFAAPLVYRAAYSLSHDHPGVAEHVAMAKAAAGDAAELAAANCLQAHGAIGYSYEYDLHLWMKRVWGLSRAWGDARAQRRGLAATLLG